MKAYYKTKNNQIEYKGQLYTIVEERQEPYGWHGEGSIHVYTIIYKGKKLTLTCPDTSRGCGGSDF